MADTYRAPKAVVAEAADETLDVAAVVRDGSPLTFGQVVEMRDGWTGDNGRSWASTITDAAVARALDVVEPADNEDDTEAEPAEEVEPDLRTRLSSLLADAISLYLSAHGAHWNVTGPDFAEYHRLFGDIYSDVYGSIDPLAENLRKLGAPAPYRLPELVAARSFTDGPSTTDAKALASSLLAANDEFLSELGEVFESATEENQQGIANFVADRIDSHQTWRWQLSATLGEEVPTQLPDMDDMPVGRSAEENDMIEERKSAIATAERFTMDAEVRAMQTDDGKPRIAGYAATFNREASALPFREVIAPGAFTRSLQSGEPVFLLVNHDTEALPLASTASGTLRLSEDSVGLRMEADLDPANPRASELISALSRGDVTKMSFAFSVAPGGETREEGLRTLTDLNLFEVSVVTWPAYDSTDVGMREASDDDLELRRRQLQLRQTQLRLRK